MTPQEALKGGITKKEHRKHKGTPLNRSAHFARFARSRAALVDGGKGNKGPQKTPGHTSKAEEHKGAKGT